MKRTLSLTGIITLVVATSALSHADTLSITIDNIKESQGTIRLQVMSGQSGFNGEIQPTVAVIQRAVAGSMTLTTNNLPAGEYAIKVMHDLNENGKLDKNFLGMPVEPWAFSNNAIGRFGSPGWDKVRFTLDGEAEQTLHLHM